MSKKITIDPLDTNSLDKAIKEIENYKKWLNEKIKELIQRVSVVGLEVASASFQMADYTGINDVVVSVENNGFTAKILASGSAVGFIEFGTGKYHNYPSSTQYTPPARGSYGKGKGNKESWIYKGLPGTIGELTNNPGYYKTKGTPPAQGMYLASLAMAEQIQDIALEVFQ